MASRKKPEEKPATAEPDASDLPPVDERCFATPGIREWAERHPGIDVAKAVELSLKLQGYAQ